MKQFGTTTWLVRSGGKLAWYEQLRMLLDAMRLRAANYFNTEHVLRNIEVDQIIPPDSALTRAAIAVIMDASEPYLFHHSMRTYFGKLLDRHPCVQYDDEAFFVSCLLHDLGLTDRYRIKEAQQHCFSQVGADMATHLAIEHQYSEQTAELIANAISLHLT